MASNKLKFCMVRSEPDVAFWYQLASRKLDDWKLSEASQQLIANVLLAPIGYGQPEPAFALDYSAFSTSNQAASSSLTLRVGGKLTVYNTIESFQEVDKQQILRQFAIELCQLISSDDFLDHPEKLLTFSLLCFADLKKYDFLYWFAFPALHFTDVELLAEPTELGKALDSNLLATFNNLFDGYAKNNGTSAFFSVFLVTEGGSTELLSLREFAQKCQNCNPFSQASSTVYFAILDGCTLPRNPSWLLRNYLVAIAHRFPLAREQCNILCLRPKLAPRAANTNADSRPPFELSDSLLLRVKLGDVRDAGNGTALRQFDCVGWERNTFSQLAPRRVRLAESMQPERLAQNAVDLNVSLMKWRAAPALNLEAIRTKRCALFGCGTLGCNVARLLLAWGVRDLVLVDQADVSYSNPVRQSLFEFADATGAGQSREKRGEEGIPEQHLRNKAYVAAHTLRRVHPGVNIVPHAISVPMPGHSVGDSETARQATRQAVESVERIIDEVDVVFLLLDSREARWLPTLVAQRKRKLVINAALGFDTFLVLRHGMQPDVSVAAECTTSKVSQLGCYFCTDVVAPTNSMRNRTLDQQCTVTRPGLSYIASAFAVELFAAVCQHPKGALADVDKDCDGEAETVLGSVPHQIRGFLSSYQFMTPSAAAFDRCSACSRSVVEAYGRDGFEFTLRAFNDPDYLEELTGLRELKRAAEQQLDDDLIKVLDDDEF